MAIIAQENFESYIANTTVINGTGGTGWTSNWQGGAFYIVSYSGTGNTMGQGLVVPNATRNFLVSSNGTYSISFEIRLSTVTRELYFFVSIGSYEIGVYVQGQSFGYIKFYTGGNFIGQTSAVQNDLNTITINISPSGSNLFLNGATRISSSNTYSSNTNPYIIVGCGSGNGTPYLDNLSIEGTLTPSNTKFLQFF